jgi:hypothetical protein
MSCPGTLVKWKKACINRVRAPKEDWRRHNSYAAKKERKI